MNLCTGRASRRPGVTQNRQLPLSFAELSGNEMHCASIYEATKTHLKVQYTNDSSIPLVTPCK